MARRIKTTPVRKKHIPLVASLASLPVFAQDPTDEAAAKIDEKFGGKIKKLFATKCNWCHQRYGMKQADDPRLPARQDAGKIMKQIRKGKSPITGYANSRMNKFRR